AAAGIIGEVNTKSWLPNPGCKPGQEASHRPRLFPSQATIERLAKAGVPLAVNSDAHYPGRILAGRGAAFRVIDSL
ncbi:MAG: hypothetical protein K2H94_03055, partial [Duncaniella sp.]|nr:hypothetical protein [Duncaniella sp.]